MTITKEKTWQYDLNGLSPVNAALGSPSTFAHLARRQTLLGIKNALTTFATLPWVVQTSSDGVSGPFAGDRWDNEQDLVWRDDDIPANNFSWIVLRQTGISAKFELLITCEEDTTTTDGSELGMWVGQSGFNAVDGGTDGTLIARPTALDERIILTSTGGEWGTGTAGSSNAYRYHVMQSDDGECTRVLLFINEVNTGFWIFDKPRNPVTGWTDPYVAAVAGDDDLSTNQCTYTKFHDAAGGRGLFNTIPTTMYFSGEGFGTNASGENFTVNNQIDDSFYANQMGLSSLTSTFIGRNGELFDLWWGLTNAETGHYYPETGTKNFVQVQHMIFPWDGTTLMGTK